MDTSELAEGYMPILNGVVSFSISNCGKLAGLDFSSGLRTVEALEVKNTSIESLRGIDAKIVANIAIEDNPKLLEVPQPKLLKVRKSLSIKAPNEEFVFSACSEKC
ncbi:protoplasts-secreted [Entomophthora muscae]|uniref:Protoplasts-secreted n=1 Tax=Entomophthora muscae TaxID=34485 RepID=A0ACC2UEK6_9FUNG|nr:protoplasts-secreted [Entomophthora muscae]